MPVVDKQIYRDSHHGIDQEISIITTCYQYFLDHFNEFYYRITYFMFVGIFIEY